MSILDFSSWLTEHYQPSLSEQALIESVANLTTDINNNFVTFDKADSNLFKKLSTEKMRHKPYVSKDGVWILGYNGSSQFSIAKLDKLSKGEVVYVAVRSSSNADQLVNLFVDQLKNKSLDDLITTLKSDQSAVESMTVRAFPIKASEILSDYVNPYAVIQYTKKLTKAVKLNVGNETKAITRGDLIKILVNGQYDKVLSGSVRSSGGVSKLKPTTVDVFAMIEQLYQDRVVIYTSLEDSSPYVSVETQGSSAWTFKLKDVKVQS